MAHDIVVNITNPNQEITISGYPEGIVFNATATSTPYVLAEPTNTTNIIGTSGATSVDVNTYTNTNAEVINIGSQLNVNLGTLFESPLQRDLDGHKYSFPNFVDSGTSNLNFGDIVMLISDLTDNANDWNAKCVAANVSSTDAGAYNSLFVFVSHINNNLIVLGKGFFDLEDSNISQWTAGRTIYLNNNNVLDITPASNSGSWIRSLGFCIPNKENKKRILFDPDSTYIKIN